MNHCDIEKLLLTAPDRRILVIGDLMLDEYVWGATERISPEAPVQVVDVRCEELRPGGAGNVAANLVALGCGVDLAGIVGEDEGGDRLLALLTEKGVGVSEVLRDSGRPTTRKSRLIAGHQQIVRVDREERKPLPEAIAGKLLTVLQQKKTAWSAIVLSDYAKGILTPWLCDKLILWGRKIGIPVLVDPKGDDFSKYSGATLITPNRKELAQACKGSFADPEALVDAAIQMRATLPVDALLLTRSEQGMTLVQPSIPPTHLPAEAREVFDVSGAGDTVVAVLALAISSGLALDQAAALANIAGGLVVAKVGTSTLSPRELLGAVMRQETQGTPKEHHREYLADILAEHRRQGQRIVFTNGCFDLLHAGHVRYLQQARQCGDLLVLGLNSDASIRRLKGPRRPLLEQKDRALVLAALECIDYLVIFDEDTPYNLIQCLQPDVLVKGGDYAPEEVVGRDIVEARGGAVNIIPFVEGRSTSRIVDSILERYSEDVD